MRTLVVGISLLAVLSLAAVAEAGREQSKSRHYGTSSADVSHDYRGRERSHHARRRGSGSDSEADIIRAESCDPAGRFDSYPAWARAAFTCGSQR